MIKHKRVSDLSIPHQRGVLSHQDVRPKEENEGVAEAQEGPVQKGFEGEQGVFTDVSDETNRKYFTAHDWILLMTVNRLLQMCTGKVLVCSAAHVDAPAAQTDCTPEWAER